MILRAPTGSYSTVLPKNPSDSQSVIYTLSGDLPPRSTASFLKIPEGIRRRIHKPRTFTDAERRLRIGALIFTTKIANDVRVSGGTRLVSPGQVLDFDHIPDVFPNIPIVSDTVATRHDNSRLDESVLGLGDSEMESVTDAATSARISILTKIENLQRDRKSLEVDVSSYKKQLSEIAKASAGVEAILSVGTDTAMDAVRTKLRDKSTAVETQLDTVIGELALIPDKIATLRDSLATLAELVK